MKHQIIAAAAIAAACGGAMAQSNIDPAHKFCWQENTGWMNWRDGGSPAGAQGVRVHSSFLSGFAWGENIGWLNLGDGTPVNGTAYSNTAGGDSGVNLAGTGDLSGFAWGENVGWVNFSTGSLGGQRARLDAAAGRLRGYAWAENIGWVNLDDSAHYIGVPAACYANCDGSSIPPVLNVNDFVCFQTRYAAGNPAANCDGSTTQPILNVNDFICFQTKYAAGCP